MMVFQKFLKIRRRYNKGNRPESSAAPEVPFMVGQICCQYSNLCIFATKIFDWPACKQRIT
jgi:hypothetical protein